MIEQPTKRRASPWIIWPACLCIFVVLYFASAGPYVWVTHRYSIGVTMTQIGDTVFWPIERLLETRFFIDSPIGGPIGRTYYDYIDWWKK
jgi:hypothetical protein